jgi:hypothetical protein
VNESDVLFGLNSGMDLFEMPGLVHEIAWGRSSQESEIEWLVGE